MKIKTFTEIEQTASDTIHRLRKGEITSDEAQQIIEENAFYLEHWRILTARTKKKDVERGYLNN